MSAGVRANGVARPDDGTRALLRSGALILVVGIVAALLIQFAFGRMSRQGPHTNTGWLLLMVAMTCLPFGVMLFGLGVAKWFRLRRIHKA